MSISYDHWKKKELWELYVCIYLILGHEPNWTELRKRRESYVNYGDCNFWNKFNEIKEIAETSIIIRTLEVSIHTPEILFCKLIPSVFLAWAKSKGFEIPEPFLEFLKEETKHKLFTGAIESKVNEPLKTINESKDNPGLPTLTPYERKTPKAHSIDHPQFMEYLKTYSNLGYAHYIKTHLEGNGYVFPDEKSYSNHLNSAKENKRVDNCSDFVRDVAIIRNAKHKIKDNQTVIAYRLPNNDPSSPRPTFTVPFRTVNEYFKRINAEKRQSSVN